MRINKIRLLLIGLFTIVVMGSGMGVQESPQIGEVGSTVSEFSLTTYDGTTFTNVDLKDKVTLLIFWYAT